jgi:cytochrome oxidase Cu insertion factor (SCO1/SenC/PrrC family)
MSPDPFSPDNVRVVTFGDDPEDDTNAYQALTALKQLDSRGLDQDRRRRGRHA